MTQLDALERQLAAFGVSDVWAAEVEMCRGIAKALDLAEFDAYMWREYRQALKSLREVLEAHGDSDGTEVVDAEWERLGEPDSRDVKES